MEEVLEVPEIVERREEDWLGEADFRVGKFKELGMDKRDLNKGKEIGDKDKTDRENGVEDRIEDDTRLVEILLMLGLYILITSLKNVILLSFFLFVCGFSTQGYSSIYFSVVFK